MIAIILPGMGIGALLLVWMVMTLSDAIDIRNSRPNQSSQSRAARAAASDGVAWSKGDSAMIVMLVIASVAGIVHFAHAISG